MAITFSLTTLQIYFDTMILRKNTTNITTEGNETKYLLPIGEVMNSVIARVLRSPSIR